MADIKDFACDSGNSVGISGEAVAELGLVFPDCYTNADDLVRVVKAIKAHDGAVHCELPFDHALEAEALGGIVNLGDEKAGPRAKEYIATKMEDLLELPEMNLETGRIRATLDACKKLREEGEQVVLEICGPFNILNVLIDAKYIFKAMRKQPEVCKEVFWKLGEQVIRFMKEAEKCGVQMISYADAAGALNILGPKMMEDVVYMYTYDYVKRLIEAKEKDTLILLCPKTTLALLGTDKAELVDRPIPGPMTFAEGCIESIGKLDIVGQQCIKNIHYRLEHGTIKEVVLK